MSTDVLVVGAGPVGLTMALELTRHGLSCRIVELAGAPTLYSKAQVLHSRTLEIAQDMGVVEPMLERGKFTRGLNVFTKGQDKPVARVVMSELDAPYPFPLSLPQHDTEVILEEALRARDRRVERTVRLVRLSQDDTGVTALVAHE